MAGISNGISINLLKTHEFQENGEKKTIRKRKKYEQ
jgi:hypothetical protein